MSTLYRCKIRAAYKPFNSKKLIVFEENQIQEAEVDLKWENSAAQSNSDTLTSAPAFYSSLSKSTCRVTINDPYLTGIGWPLLYDAASLYQKQGISATQIMLPSCGKGEDPIKNKCRNYVDAETENLFSLGGGPVDDYPHILISMWYDVKGTRFGNDYFFRVVNMSINQGSSAYPTVQITGEEARSILFNQTLVNYGFPEGTKFDDAIAKIVKDYGYTPSFCYADYTKYKLLQPTATRDTGVTPAEAIKRRLNAVGGVLNTQPVREWADKISICTRNEVNQGCKVFYLGVGLFENYTIDGIPNTLWQSNLENGLEPGSNINSFSTYGKPIFEADEFLLDGNMLKNLRAQKLKNLTKNKFPGQFEPIKTRFDSTQATSGAYFEIAGPRPHGKTAVKVKSVNDTQFYGVSPNGTNSISYLDGLILDADEKNGRVLILTKYFIYGCMVMPGTTTQKCFSGPIYQEVRNLTKLKVSKVPNIKNLVTMNQAIGTSTKEKPDYVRFYIAGVYSVPIEVSLDIIAKFAIPEEGLTAAQVKDLIGEQPSLNTAKPAGSTGLGPTANYGEVQPTTNTNAPKILIMAGHADLRSTGTGVDGIGREVDANIRALTWVHDNASKYGIANILEFYSPPSSNIVDSSSPDSQFSKTTAAIAAGKQVIELHHDRYDSAGRSGVIFPYSGKKVFPLDTAISKIYGSFGRDFTQDGTTLGVPRRGGTILEIAPFLPENAKRALSSNKAISDAYFKQALEPFMLSIARQYSGSGSTTTPSVQPSEPSGGGMIPVGMVGQTGEARGIHLHAEFMCNKRRCQPSSPRITPEDVAKYVEIQGYPNLSAIVSDPFGAPRQNGTHRGIDFAAPNISGKAVYVKNGVQVVDPVGDCQNGVPKCGDGYGNSVIIITPENKQIILAHFAPGSVSVEGLTGRIAGTGAASGAGKSDQGLSGGPTAQGLNITTSFKGVPRSLRIIPGRTILSFITEYDNWLEQGKPRSIDPGIWLPERFSKYFINRCTYKWRGDLRVDLRGVIDWGFTKIETPTFKSYMNDLIKSGQVKELDPGDPTGYFRYIRSLGDLCYKVAGKDSCETICAEIEEFEKFMKAKTRTETTSPNVTTNYAQGPCRYNGSELNARQTTIANGIMDALYSAGVRTKEGFAGVLGNAFTESTMNPGVHLTRGKGGGCTKAYKGKPPKHPGYGIFQWCYDRQDAISAKCGAITDPKSGELNCQMAYTLQELNSDKYRSVIEKLNSASSAGAAATEWNSIFEQGHSTTRAANAELLKPGIKCDRVN